jgi:hypothetical protein
MSTPMRIGLLADKRPASSASLGADHQVHAEWSAHWDIHGS